MQLTAKTSLCSIGANINKSKRDKDFAELILTRQICCCYSLFTEIHIPLKPSCNYKASSGMYLIQPNHIDEP